MLDLLRNMACVVLFLKSKENRKNYKEGFDKLHIYITDSCVCTGSNTLDRKDRLKNRRGTTLKVAMLADVSGAPSAILSVYL